MWSPDRRSFLLAALVPLAGCGFAPAYGTNGRANALRGAVRVDDPTDPETYAFLARVEEVLGPPEAPRYALSYRIRTKEWGVSISRDDLTSRYQLFGEVAYSVKDLSTGKQVHSGTGSNFVGYSGLGSAVSSRAAKVDGEKRLMRQLADQVTEQLIATYGSWKA
ncbi:MULTISPECIES: hypothetical protein [unclassified Haematobacter]|uniref:hypothetical protein n=1 Tax=unclassified Haematobacter TaxID=2640585 RepID=UPI0025BF69A5|nr:MULTISPECIES: hypothetical protein [unclassified Haematobacter]